MIERLPPEFEFTLLLDGISEITDEFEDAVFEAGCNDCTISERMGRVFVTFARRADSLKDAVVSAIQDLRRADENVYVNRVDSCTLVTQAEIGRKIERTRQMVHQYITGERGPGGFPPPACNIIEGTPLWYWCEVAVWLEENNLISETDLREAQEVAAINGILDLASMFRDNADLTVELMEHLKLPNQPRAEVR